MWCVAWVNQVRLAKAPEMEGCLACSATLAESETANGVPELWVVMTFSCQSSRIAHDHRQRRGDAVLAAGAGDETVPGVEQGRAYSASRSNGFWARSPPASGFAAAPDRFIAER